MEKFKDKYRVQSNRMAGWDYAQGGKYFITICTRNRIFCFGDVVNGEMRLNEMGIITRKYWMEIPEHFSNTYVDEFQIMPNHIHGIIIMVRSGNSKNVMKERDETRSRLYIPEIPANTNEIKKNILTYSGAVISPKPGSLPVIIGGFKSKCTKAFKRIGHGNWFDWQPRFHDRILRNDAELKQIRQYIKNNPANWDHDEYNIPK